MMKTKACKAMEECCDVQSVFCLQAACCSRHISAQSSNTKKGGTNTTFPRVRDTNDRAF